MRLKRFVVALTLLVVLVPSAAASPRRTFVYVKGRQVGYVEYTWVGAGVGVLWFGSWAGTNSAWVESRSKDVYVSGCGNDYRLGVARRGRAGRWRLDTFPGFSPVGTLARIDRSRWRVLSAGRQVATVEGRDAPQAALAWMTVGPRICHG